MINGILGTSKKKPILSVSPRPEDKNLSVLTYGLEDFITFPNNPESIQFKIVVGMLSSSDIIKKQIQDIFQIDYKTVIRYEKIFKASDGETLIKLLRSPGRPVYKMNDEIENYIINRFIELKKKKEIKYSKTIIMEVKNKFNIELSREKIRQICREVNKNKIEKIKMREPIKLIGQDNSKEKKMLIPQNREIQNEYAGILIINIWVGIFFNEFPESNINGIKYSTKEIFIHWMYGILLGKQNLEQFRYLRMDSFCKISGIQNKLSVESMRLILYNISIHNFNRSIGYLLKENIENFTKRSSDYYIDGHFKEYTGALMILEGWHSIKHMAVKGTWSYFVHDLFGNPVYFNENDCFYDLRDMIKKMIKGIEKINLGKNFTIIYDRGGFSFEVCEYIEENGKYFITWEKGFRSEGIKEKNFKNKMIIRHPRNDVGNFKEYKIKYYSEEYKIEDYKWRRILILREENHKIQSIITNDSKRKGAEVIERILGRFLQENDFKKIKGHFGFDELTSYKKLEYNGLKDKDKSKEVETERYKELTKEISDLKNERKEIFIEIGVKIFKHANVEKVNKKILTKDRKEIEKILKINKKIKEKQIEKRKSKKMMSKLEKCILEGKEEIDLRPKNVMGILKICARNIFMTGAKEFLKNYPNLRDYQEVFRQLVRSSGSMIYEGNLILVKIKSFGSKSLKEKIENFLDKINSMKPKTLDEQHELKFSLQ